MTGTAGTPTRLRIDFVSDVVCPWCAVGLMSLEQALQRTAGEVEAEIHFQPFELNPQMPAAGEDAAGHLQRKYGMPPEQAAANQQAIVDRGAELGFTFDMQRRARIYNTFDAHRLLHWAGEQGRDEELALKQALLRAYFTDDLDVSSHDGLAAAAVAAGLDGDQARQVLASDRHAAEVRARERLYQERGISAVPSVIINDRHLIQGGQPVELFEQALRQVASEAVSGQTPTQ